MSFLASGCAKMLQPDAATAARADSSAAGYDVGISSANEPPVVVALLGEARVQWRTHAAPRIRRLMAPVSLPPVIVRPHRTSGPPIDSTASAADTARSRPRVTTPIRTDSALRVVAVVDTQSMPDSVDVDEFLSFQPRLGNATLRLFAGHSGENDALNFNGGANGSHVLTVPLGWRVQLRFANEDATLPHSAIVIPQTVLLPITVPAAAFPQAFTMKLQEGLADGDEDRVSFAAASEGEYMIVCGVPGHGQGGMWIRLVVSRAALVPTYERR